MILVHIGRWSYGRFQDDNNIFYKIKNDLTTGTWKGDIWCPINIILFCTSDVDGYEFNIDIFNDDEYSALQKESLMLLEGYCIFGFQEFYRKIALYFGGGKQDHDDDDDDYHYATIKA